MGSKQDLWIHWEAW